MRLINKEFLVFVIFLLLTILILWQFLLKGLYPFPGDFLLSFYEPWKTDFTINNVPIISHKAVADDVFRQLYPFKILESGLLKNLELPLWNPYNGAGMPFFATIHSGFLNIFNGFFLFLPGFLAWSFYIMIQPFLLSIFTYLYCRKINLSPKASLFCVFTLVFSGFVIARLIFGEYIYVFSMLPLILYLIESFIQNKNKIILLLPFSIFFLMTSGQPQMIFYVLTFIFFYVLYRSPKTIINLLPFFLIGFGLSAVQLIPTFELFQNSALNAISSRFIFDRFILPPQHLIGILIPNYFGNQGTYNYWGSGDYIETVASIGLIPVFFAFLSLGGKIKAIDVRKFFFISTILTLLSTLDWFGPRLIFSLPLPLISTGVPSRIFGLTSFSLAILCGYGFERWIKSKNIDKKIIIKLLLFSSIVLIIVLGTFIFYKLKISCNNSSIFDCRTIALRNSLLETGFFSIFLFFFISFFKIKALKKISPIIVLFLILLLGIYNSQKFLPFSKKETFMPKNDLISALEKTNDSRVFGLGSANIKTDFATYFRFYDPNYYDPLYNRRFGELISFANKGIISSLARSDVEIVSEINPIERSIRQRRERLFEILGVNYLIFKKTEINTVSQNKFWEDKNWIIIKNTGLPRAYTVSDFEVISDKNSLLKRFFDPSFDPQRAVILEEKPALPLAVPANDTEIKIEKYYENSLQIRSNSKTNQILVLSDNYYPGWKSFIDGGETKIYRANYTFRAILLPQGSHKIEFKYQPESLKIGMIISLLSLFSYFGLFLFRSFKNSKSG